MSITRTASAYWNGRGTDGQGQLVTASTVLNGTPYSYATRLAEGKGTNPEELIAAAHAGCLSMKVAFVLQAAGYTATRIDTRCEVALHDGLITQSNLSVRATVPGLDDATFQKLITNAWQNCPVSQLLNTDINCQATLLPSNEVVAA